VSKVCLSAGGSASSDTGWRNRAFHLSVNLGERRPLLGEGIVRGDVAKHPFVGDGQLST